MRSPATNHPVPDFPCQICGRSVDLRTAETDGNGQAVHADCYARRSSFLGQPGEKDQAG
jgi:hypothetical protein